MTDYLPGYDAWVSREPEYAEEPLPEEDEPEEPEIEELWDGNGAYIHIVTMRPSGRKFYVRQATSGAFVSDFEVIGKGGVIAEGFLDPEAAIDWLCDPERRDW